MQQTPPPSARNERVVATMCMLHARFPASLKAVRSLRDQVNTLYLCLNDFCEVPPELKQNWIEILHLGENLGDAARLQLLRNRGPADVHVLSCDDDLEYPESYVRDFLAAREQHPNALLTHHGYIARYSGKGRFKYEKVVRFRREQNEARRLTVPGSGVSFIPAPVFNQLEFSDLLHLNQVDIHLACNCLKLGVPIMGLAHRRGYFKEIRHKTSVFNSVTSQPDWMDKVYQIYQSYDLSLTAPPAAANGEKVNGEG